MTSFRSITRSAKTHLPIAGYGAGPVCADAQTLGARLTLKGALTCVGPLKSLDRTILILFRVSASGTFTVRSSADPDARTLGIIQLAILNRLRAKPERATAREITDDLSKLFGERIPDAQVFVTLARLRDRGLVEAVTSSAKDGDSLDEKQYELDSQPHTARLSTSRTSRGRRAATMKLTPLGVEAVEQAARILLESAATP